MAAPLRHGVDCDKRLLFYPLSKFPIKCDNSQDPISFEELAPYVGRKSIVYEFSPDGSTTCWDAASLYLTLEAMKGARGGGVYRHPIHNCIISDEDVQMIFHTARLSTVDIRKALKEMLTRLRRIAVAGSEIAMVCFTYYQFCMNPTWLMDPLNQLLALSPLFVAVLDSSKRVHNLWYPRDNENPMWNEWKRRSKKVNNWVPSQNRIETYERFKRQHGRGGAT
jgi:hypothetical protein